MIWHCGVMPTGKLPSGGQHILQVAAPQCRVFAEPPAPCLREVQNTFDASAKPRGCFRLFLPDGIQHSDTSSVLTSETFFVLIGLQ